MAPSTDPKNALTDRERELMALAWLCFSEKPKPDYKKLASLAGMSNPVSASNAWSKIQKKITAQAEDVSGSGQATPEMQTPKATPGKKRGAGKAAAGGDGESPTKKKKTPAKKATKVKEEVVEDELDGLDGEDVDGGEEDAGGESETAFF